MNRAQSWQGTVELHFPSGNVADVVPPSIFHLARNSGELPTFLHDMFSASLQGGAAETDTPPLTLADMAQMGAFVDGLLVACFVSPQVVPDNPDVSANQISTVQVVGGDKLFFLQWAMEQLGVSGVAVSSANKSAEQPSDGLQLMDHRANLRGASKSADGDDQPPAGA